MLYFETVEPKTLELLKDLQCVPIFKSLRLVGGTALALQFGHRKSVDIDLFGKLEIDQYELINTLNKIGKTVNLKNSKNINIFMINDIKVDIVNYPYEWLLPPVKEKELNIASIEDIACMKMEAITGRGTKKDFIDLFFLLKHYTLAEILNLYKKKYQSGSEFLVLKSLSYFKDAEKDEEPDMLIKSDWNKIKQTISNKLEEYLNRD